MIERLMRALLRWDQADVKFPTEDPSWTVGRRESWVRMSEEGRLCSFFLLVCEKRGISLGFLYFGLKKGPCQNRIELKVAHRLASLPVQTRILTATGANKQAWVCREPVNREPNSNKKRGNNDQFSSNPLPRLTSSYGSSPNR